jgi:hypothetical protein
MTPPTINAPAPTTLPAAMPMLPVEIEHAMRRSGANYYRALDLPLDTYADQAARADCLAAACSERATCWAAVAGWASSTGSTIPWPLGSAVLAARRREDDAARFWRDTAIYWRRAAAGADPRELDAEDVGLLDHLDHRDRWVS